MEKQFKDVVERSSDRKVLAYMSQIHTNPDLAVELSCSSRRNPR
jgi:hypothetical protein